MPDYITNRIRIDRVRGRYTNIPAFDIYIDSHFIGRETSLKEAQERANEIFDVLERRAG